MWNDDSESFEAKAISSYSESCKIPSIASGRVFRDEENPQNVVVESSWKQRDVRRSKMGHYDRVHFVHFDEKGSTVHETPFPHERSKGIQVKKASPSSKYLAVVSSTDEKKQFLEIWKKDHLLCNYDVSSSKEHGKIICEEPFGYFDWSNRDDKLLYVAEKYFPKPTSFFETKDSGNDSQTDDAQNAGKGKQYEYRETWGEQQHFHHPLPVVFDVDAKTAKVIEGIPETLSVGQVHWDANDAGIFFVGWKHFPRRLGVIFCDNRPSAVYYLKFADSSLELLSFQDRSVTAMTFNPSNNTIMFLDRPVGGPHRTCQRLVLVDVKSKVKTIIVDVVTKITGDDFPGLFVHSLADRPWLNDKKKIVFSTQWKSNSQIISVDVESKRVEKVPLPDLSGSWTVLDVNRDLVLCSFSSFSSPFQLFLLHLKETPSGKDDVVPIELTRPSVSFEDQFTWQSISFMPVSEPFKDIPFDALLLEPTGSGDEKRPLLVCPHGGPHGCFPTAFSSYATSFCLLDFAVLFVNYRGSTGFGKASIDCLLGNVGTVDVHDVHQAVCQVAASGKIDQSRIFVMGGSHGGFLTAHLVGQYPDYYRAACLRNPVTNFASMVGVSDIPDWVYAEAGLDYSYKQSATAAVLKAMIDVSPIRHVDKVKTPCLFSIGAKDLRVPPSQGLEFYHALRARGVATELYMYPDSCHPISEVDAEADAFIHAVMWFFRHGKSE